MKRRDLLRWLAAHGCRLQREGASHSWWVNPEQNRIDILREVAGPGFDEAWGKRIEGRYGRSPAH